MLGKKKKNKKKKKKKQTQRLCAQGTAHARVREHILGYLNRTHSIVREHILW
jgi:hypothetical protein